MGSLASESAMTIRWPYWLGAIFFVLALTAMRAHFVWSLVVGALWAAVCIRMGWIRREQ